MSAVIKILRRLTYKGTEINRTSVDSSFVLGTHVGCELHRNVNELSPELGT